METIRVSQGGYRNLVFGFENYQRQIFTFIRTDEFGSKLPLVGELDADFLCLAHDMVVGQDVYLVSVSSNHHSGTESVLFELLLLRSLVRPLGSKEKLEGIGHDRTLDHVHYVDLHDRGDDALGYSPERALNALQGLYAFGGGILGIAI